MTGIAGGERDAGFLDGQSSISKVRRTGWFPTMTASGSSTDLTVTSNKTGMSAAFSVLTTKTFDFVSLPAEDPRDRTTSKDRTSLDVGTAPPPTVDTTPGPTI